MGVFELVGYRDCYGALSGRVLIGAGWTYYLIRTWLNARNRLLGMVEVAPVVTLGTIKN